MGVTRCGLRIGLVVVLCVVGVGFLGQAVEVTVLSSEKTVDPGQFTTHVFSVQNDTSAAVDYRLHLEAPSGWSLLGVPSSVSLDAGASQTLFVTVTVPSGAAAGTYRITLQATSPTDPRDTAQATAVTKVSAVNAVVLVLPDGQSVSPGATATYDVGVLNKGNAQDTFRFEASSAHGFAIHVSQGLVGLASQEKATVTVTVDVPADAQAGRDVLQISVVSTQHPAISDTETLFTTVLPPKPQAVGGTLLASLPARLQFSFGRDVLSGIPTSDLTFSLSGTVFGGFFKTFLQCSSLFGPDPPSADAFWIAYRKSPADFTIGDVSQTVTDLFALSCRGASVTVDSKDFRLQFLGGEASGPAVATGRFALGPRQANLGVAYLGSRSSSVNEQAWSLTAFCEPLAGWSVRAEGGLGIQSGKTGRALLLGTTIDTASYFLSARAYSVGTFFPGILSDQAGVSMSQRLQLKDFSLGATIDHLWNNVDGNPLVPRVLNDDLQLNVMAAPLTDGPTLLANLDYSWLRDADRALGDRVTQEISVALQKTDGTVPYTLGGDVTDVLDRVAGTSVRTLVLSGGIGLSTDAVDGFLTLTQTWEVDRSTDAVLSAGTGVSLWFETGTGSRRATIILDTTGDVPSLGLDATVGLLENLTLDLGSTIEWHPADATPTAFSGSLGFDWTFDLPVPFLVTKGRIDGRVFIDENSDGRFDAGDRPVENAVLTVGKTEVATDRSGTFRFPPLDPGEYRVAVHGLPADAATPAPSTIVLHAGQTVQESIALRPVILVSGTVFDDVNKNGALDAGETGFGQVVVVLTGADSKVRRTTTDAHGRFAFSGIGPGSYSVSLDPATLPERFAFTTPQTASFTVPSSKPVDIAIGGSVKPKQVVITYQPPTADFTWSPEQPKVGELVLFDGSDSFDFDGTITSYAWDLNGDGKTDATQVHAQITFSTPGPHDVTLTVTDNDGNTDSVTHTITVRP